MNKLEIIENKEKNIKLEFRAGIIALMISLVFVFSNHLAQSYQIYSVILLFFVHQINQSIIFNRWNFNAEFKLSKIWLRIIVIALVLIFTLWNFATIHSDYSFYFNLPRGKKANTFYSIAIYCGIYFIVYLFGLRKNKTSVT
ncbi:MAG: hypothetical protein AB8H03_26375 [Saprospiraceae bacterium]